MTLRLNASSDSRSGGSPEESPLRKYWEVIQRQQVPIVLVTGVVFGLTAFYTMQQKPTFQATGKLLFKTDKKPELVGLKNDSGQLQALTQKSDPLTTQGEIIRSAPIVKSTIKALRLTDAKGDLINEASFTQGLTVKPIIGTDILELSYQSDDAKQAAEIVNHIMQAYITSNVGSNRSEAAAAREFIQRQLPASEAAVSRAESQLRQFKEQNNVVSLQQESSVTVDSIATLNQRINDARSQLAQMNAKSSELRSQTGTNPQAGLSLNRLNEADSVKEALKDLHEVQAKLGQEQARFKSSHPAIELLKRQEAEAQATLDSRMQEVLGQDRAVTLENLQTGKTTQGQISALAETEVDRSRVEAELRSLDEARNRYTQRAQVLPSLEKAQRQLERQLEAAQTTYKTLLTKLQEVQVTENQTVGNAEIVAAAETPSSPISPRLMLNLMAGGVFGLLLGLMTAFLIDYRDRTVKTLRDSTQLFDYPLLGVIPKVSYTDEQAYGVAKIYTNQSQIPAQESYQMLHTGLRFLTSERKSPKSIVVTSSVRGEGKTTVAANLAIAMAQVHRRVLLIDADMRNPHQHHIWDVINRVGFSNVIIGQERLENVVYSVMSNLHVLTAGSLPPNPISLLDSRRTAELIEEFGRHYDVILFDAPPLSGTADATILNKMTDGSLLVVRPDVITANSAKAARQFLAQSGQTVLGMVVNGLDTKRGSDGEFYFNPEESVLATMRRGEEF
jgi:polysaccharide biosynthesis transport protein